MRTYNDKLRFAGVCKNRVFTGPKYVTLHLTNMCNLNCVYCWYHSHYVKSKNEEKQSMNFDLFKKIIDECNFLGVEMISFSGEGEPLLHPQIGEMLDYVKRKKIRTAVFTNGTFGKHVIKYIANVDSLSVNLSTLDKETHSFLQGKSGQNNFDRVIKNIRILSELKKRQKEDKPRIEIVFIINGKNYNEIEDIFNFALKLNLDVCFRFMKTREEIRSLRISEDQVNHIKEALKNVIRHEKKTDIETNAIDLLRTISSRSFLKERRVYYPSDNCYRNFYYTELFDKKIKCYIGWYFAIVHVNGDVFLCCHNPNSRVGNVHERTFKDIWSSKDAEKMRTKFKYDFDIENDFWIECHLCSFTNLNKDIHDKIIKMPQTNG